MVRNSHVFDCPKDHRTRGMASAARSLGREARLPQWEWVGGTVCFQRTDDGYYHTEFSLSADYLFESVHINV